MFKWIKKHLPKRRKVMKDSSFSYLGAKAEHPSLWRFDKKSVSRGMSIGLFVAFIPLPMQMLISVLLSIVFKGNIPIAIAATWITNPITFIPINLFIGKVGQLILGDNSQSFHISKLDFQIEWHNMYAMFIDWIVGLGKPFLIGLPIVAFSAAFIGFMMVQICWGLFSSTTKRKKIRKDFTMQKIESAVEIGKQVPMFDAQSNKGVINLQDYKGKYLVIYFYPKDNTPGCNLEAQDFRDLYSKFQSCNVEVLGVSRDTLESHTKFECKFNLPFPLISDRNSNTCDMFGVIKQKSIFGKTALGLIRSTFLIDPTGILIKEWRNVKVSQHAQQVLDAIIELQSKA